MKTSLKGNQELQENRKSQKNHSTKNRSKRNKARIIIMVEVDLAICSEVFQSHITMRAIKMFKMIVEKVEVVGKVVAVVVVAIIKVK